MGNPRIIAETPTRLRILGASETQIDALRASLTYTDERVVHELRRLRRTEKYARTEEQREALEARKLALRVVLKPCLLMEDLDGHWTYTGLAEKVSRILNLDSGAVESLIEYPDPGDLGWDRLPEHTPYPFQTRAQCELLLRRHAGVEIGTGLGKSLIIEYIVKELALPTVIMAPYIGIAKQLYEECVQLFGERKVGFFGDGVKKPRMITVAVAASLTKVEEGTEEWKKLSAAQVFIADESHLLPADTLAKVCFGLMAEVPYRFFFSATQVRTDGLDLLLDAIVGPIVYRMTVREGIDEGYLAKLDFAMVRATSASDWQGPDANAMTREHLYYNPQVIQRAASLINRFVGEYGQQVLVLVEEVEQYTRLYPMLRFPSKFAHGGVSKDNAKRLPKVFHDSDPSKFVREFNDGEFPILVGTSCISTGVNVRANEVTINLQGGRSLISVMQGPSGRSTRLYEYLPGRKWRAPGRKMRCAVVDFDVENVPVLHEHAEARRRIYEDIYGPVRSV